MKTAPLVVAPLCAFAVAGCRSTGSGLPESLFATVDGHRVHYAVEGRGEKTFVFVHGWGGSVESWREQVHPIAVRARVVRIDLPGHGESDAPRIDYTVDHFARAVGAVMDDADVDRAVLVGHSLGALVVRHFYRLDSHRVEALVFDDGRVTSFGTRESLEPFVAPFRGEAYKEAIARFVEALLPTPGSEALRAEAIATISLTPQHVLVSAMENLSDPRYFEPDPIRVPVIAIHARAFLRPEEEEALHGFIDDLDFRVWDRVGHFPMLEMPDRFNSALLGLL